MSERNVEDALAPHIQVEEKSRRTLDEYPSDIVEQLKRAAFSEAEAANTYVKRVQPTNDSQDSRVVTVELAEDGLVIEAKDVVGIVNLTPNATLQIDPKIGWSEIINMFLAVGEQRRTLEYRGIPIREFLADDIGIEDVFIIVALNYLNSLDDIFRHGLIRSFNQRRTQGLEGRGRIDIEQSLKNFDLPNGVPKLEFVEKTVEYSIPVNDVIFRAGVELERLFHLYASSTPTDSYVRIFSRLERAVKRLKHRGVTGKSVSLTDVSQVTVDDIPRQRYYYANALQISKTILSSTIGQPLEEGREELLMEYIIGMESLFEEFVALTLNEERDSLEDLPHVRGFEDIAIAKESYRLFEDDSLTYSSQPDHVIVDSHEPVAVLDSKYYSKEKNPLDGSWARSRLLSYGFQLQTDCLGMIAPLATSSEHKFDGRPGSLHVIAPHEEQFSTDGLRRAIRAFLQSAIGEDEGIPAKDDLKTREICHPDVGAQSLREALNEPALRGKALADDAYKILKYITNDARLSKEVNSREAAYMRPLQTFKRHLSEHINEYEVAIPIFVSSDDPEADVIADAVGKEGQDESRQAKEFIRFHCINLDKDGTIIDYATPTPFSIDW